MVTQAPPTQQTPADVVHITSTYKALYPVGGTVIYVTLGDIPGPVTITHQLPETFTTQCAMAPWYHYNHAPVKRVPSISYIVHVRVLK